MKGKKNEPLAPVYGGCMGDPAYERYMKKCLKKNPFLYKMIDCIVDQKIAALRAELCHCMWTQRPGYPGGMFPGAMGPVGMQSGMMSPMYPAIPGFQPM